MSEGSTQKDEHLIISSDDSSRVVARNLGEPGDPGIGFQGPAGASFFFQGDWDSVSAYNPGDIVVHARENGGDGSSFLCIQGNTNAPPVESSDYWTLFVQSSEEGPEGAVGSDFTGTIVNGTWRGGWTAAQTYLDNDVVFFDGSAWVCIDPHQSNTSNQPQSGSTVWQRFARQGGIGPRGDQGPQGPKGNRGPAGPRGDRGPRGFGGTVPVAADLSSSQVWTISGASSGSPVTNTRKLKTMRFGDNAYMFLRSIVVFSINTSSSGVQIYIELVKGSTRIPVLSRTGTGPAANTSTINEYNGFVYIPSGGTYDVELRVRATTNFTITVSGASFNGATLSLGD